MYLYFQEGTTISKEQARNKHLSGLEGDIKINGHIDMKLADGSILIGWLASQLDMLSNDWFIC